MIEDSVSNKNDKPALALPVVGLSRFSKLGFFSHSRAGNMLADGVSELSEGQPPKLKDLPGLPQANVAE